MTYVEKLAEAILSEWYYWGDSIYTCIQCGQETEAYAPPEDIEHLEDCAVLLARKVLDNA